MKNDDYMNFGEEISKSVRHVLNSREIQDLKQMINDTVQILPGIDGSKVFRNPQSGWDDGFRLSKEEQATAQADPFSYGQAYGKAVRNENAPAVKRRTKKGGWLGTLMFVVGLIGLLPCTAALVICAGVFALIGAPAIGWGVATVLGTFALGFAALAIAGSHKKKQWKRFQIYQRVLGGRDFCEIKELASALGKKEEYVCRDLKKMIGGGLFKEGYLDEQEACFMLDYDTYRMYLSALENSKKREQEEALQRQRWANHPGGKALRQTVEEGRAYIIKIKEANDLLPEPEISEKLNELEKVTSRIFAYVEQHPEKLPEIRKLMCYYMPITLKLVGAYQEFEKSGSVKEDVSAAKLEIKGTLDTINKAYQNLLQKLMQTDFWDISSDISALETILAQEGLTN